MLRGFSLSILFGVIVGTNSTIFIAVPILIYLCLQARGEVAFATAGNRAPQPAE